MRDGFLRVAAVAPKVRVADVEFNTKNIIDAVNTLRHENVELVLFPELSVTGYTCADLFHNFTLLQAAEKAFENLRLFSTSCEAAFVVGLPVAANNAVYNCAVFFSNGEVSIIPKTYLPNYNEFYERRWFAPAPETPITVSLAGNSYQLSVNGIIRYAGVNIAIEICEDLWAVIPPSSAEALKGAELILNLSASDDLTGKYQYLLSLIKSQSARCIAAYAYASAGFGESSTDLVFDGKAIIAENGRILAKTPRWNNDAVFAIADIDILALRRDRFHNTTFAECGRRNNIEQVAANDDDSSSSLSDLKYRDVEPHPFVPSSADDRAARCAEIINIQAAGLAQRLNAIHCKNLVVGISGGLDSTLALLVAVHAFDRLNLDRKGILGVTMPGFGTTDRTHDNAVKLMEALGVSSREISIVKAVNQHFIDIAHDPAVHDVTYENSQARQRTLLLMDIANQTNGLVLGTGDLSELALGWATYNGDHMSMYGVNAGVPKTLVRHLVKWFAEEATDDELRNLLLDIVDTPVSPELLPADSDGKIAQKTEDLVGPYELHDFFLYYTLRYGFSKERILRLATKAFKGAYSQVYIEKWADVFFRRFFAQQFKRSCLPDGPKVGSVCLSPRGDWRMPSDASSALF